ncbi:MAG: hypothetical protein ABR503_10820 [Chitinophagaceae bacterium]
MLNQLEELKKTFGIKEQSRLAKLLTQLSRHRFKDASSLIQLHESLMFMLAYPQSEKLLDQTKKLLASFPKRIEYLKKIEADLASFGEPEISGIAGTSVTVMLGYKFAHWLSLHHTSEVEIDWEGYEEEPGIRSTLPRILPLLEEEALVEAHISFVDYIHAAKPKRAKDLAWLMREFSQLDISEKEKVGLYDSLKLYIRFSPGYNSSRTGQRRNVRKIFYHEGPLIQRRDISLKKELEAPALKFEKLSAKEGLEILALIRTASAVRCRELHGFVWCDEKSFIKIDIGRGVIIFLNEVLPENRLPFRAYHSGFIFKNGVPIGYVEVLSLFEKMEIGFNLYYTFRDGETAWLFSQLLRIFKQHLGVTVFSVDPYQIGHENEEGIESGAFWFYRKLGFYPMRDEVTKIVEREEKKLSESKDYRTPAKILRKIAISHLLYTHTNSPSGNQWKDFHLRNILLAVQERMSQRFNGNMVKMKKATLQKFLQLLNVDLKQLKETGLEAYSNYALVFSLIPKVDKWTKEEKELIVKVLGAKASGSEVQYLKLMQKHRQFREALIGMGSKNFLM